MCQFVPMTKSRINLFYGATEIKIFGAEIITVPNSLSFMAWGKLIDLDKSVNCHIDASLPSGDGPQGLLSVRFGNGRPRLGYCAHSPETLVGRMAFSPDANL